MILSGGGEGGGSNNSKQECRTWSSPDVASLQLPISFSSCDHKSVRQILVSFGWRETSWTACQKLGEKSIYTTRSYFDNYSWLKRAIASPLFCLLKNAQRGDVSEKAEIAFSSLVKNGRGRAGGQQNLLCLPSQSDDTNTVLCDGTVCCRKVGKCLLSLHHRRAGPAKPLTTRKLLLFTRKETVNNTTTTFIYSGNAFLSVMLMRAQFESICSICKMSDIQPGGSREMN